ncbi:MAG TPA: VOC family protein [Ensifer sp.]|nr:VOC family protein [Ensifer sp.]
MSGLRAIDHLVLAVTDLATARARLSSLGFTVAPDARHPFGTENACVFLRDGTYLEPLAIGSDAESLATARAGNVFTARDRAFRFRHGHEGLEAVVFRTGDAVADHDAYIESGFSAGQMLEFSRLFRTPSGEEGEASFRLAFAADLRSPDFHVFTCERINTPQVDRAPLVAHDNGATGLAGVTLCETNPEDFRDFLEAASRGGRAERTGEGLRLETGDASLSVVMPAAFETRFGRKYCGHARGLRGRAISFHVVSLDETATLLRRNGVVHETIGKRLVVPEASGQGVLYSFEEKA